MRPEVSVPPWARVPEWPGYALRRFTPEEAAEWMPVGDDPEVGRLWPLSARWGIMVATMGGEFVSCPIFVQSQGLRRELWLEHHSNREPRFSPDDEPRELCVRILQAWLAMRDMAERRGIEAESPHPIRPGEGT